MKEIQIAIGIVLLMMVPTSSAHASEGFFNQEAEGVVTGEYHLCLSKVTDICVREFAGEMNVVVAWSSTSTWICGPEGHENGDTGSAAVTYVGAVLELKNPTGAVEVQLDGTGSFQQGYQIDEPVVAYFTVGGVPYVGTWSVDVPGAFTPFELHVNRNAWMEFSVEGENALGGTFRFSGAVYEGAYYESSGEVLACKDDNSP